MTDEQKQTVAEIRNSIKKWGSLSIGGAVEQIETLLEIIDHLQKTIETMTKERDEARENSTCDPLNTVAGGPGAPGYDL